MNPRNKSTINIITGERHTGKTTFLIHRIQQLKDSGHSISGIISRGTFVDGKRYSFYIQDVSTQEEQLLMCSEPKSGTEKIGKFFFAPHTFEWGTSVLQKAIKNPTKVIVLDEIGKLELEDNKGWAPVLKDLLQTKTQLFLVVREEWVSKFIEKYQLGSYQIIQVDSQ